MPTITEIASAALIKLGHHTINDIDEGSPEANIAKVVWDYTRRDVLRDYPWNFAIKRAVVAPLAGKNLEALGEGATGKFKYIFPIPADSLRIIEVGDSPYIDFNQYQLESGGILSDEKTLNVRYISEVTDFTKFDSTFLNAVTIKMAIEMCEAITQSTSKKRGLAEEYEATIGSAKRSDAQENKAIRIVEDTWLTARY